jgi:hypothetical protein
MSIVRRLTARAGPSTDPATSDLEGVRNASPPELFDVLKKKKNFSDFFPNFFQIFYVRNYFVLLVLTDYYPLTHICT